MKNGFLRRLIKYKSVYQAFYGSPWWMKRVPVIFHIGRIYLKYIAYKNSKISTI